MTPPVRTAEQQRVTAPTDASATRSLTNGAALGPPSTERLQGNSATAGFHGALARQTASPTRDGAREQADRRTRAHRLVAAVEEMLAKHTSDAATRAKRWEAPVTLYTVELRCRDALHHVRRLEVALRGGEPFYADRWTSAIGALKLAQPYLDRMVEPDGPARVAASIRALEMAAGLAPGRPVPGTGSAPKPLSHGWHKVVDDESGDTLGYVEVVEATYHRYYDSTRQYIGGWEAPIVSEGLGPLDYIPIAAGLGAAAYKIGGALATALAKSFVGTATKRAAARAAVIGGAVMGGVAEATPAVAGRLTNHAFILSESLTAEAVAAEAQAAARASASTATRELELETATEAAKATTTSTTTTGGGSGGTAVAAGAGWVTPSVPAHVASLGEQAEAPVLSAHHAGAAQLTEKYKGYDAYKGGTVTSYPTLEKVKGREPVLVWNRVVTDAEWISLKRVLELKDATPENIHRHVDSALRDMEREADESKRMDKTPRRGSIPIAPNTYVRIWKKNAKGVTLHVTTPGPLSAEQTRQIEEAARRAALNSGRLDDIPPFTLLINGKQIPLK